MRPYHVTGPYLLDSLVMLVWASLWMVSVEVTCTLVQGKDSNCRNRSPCHCQEEGPLCGEGLTSKFCCLFGAELGWCGWCTKCSHWSFTEQKQACSIWTATSLALLKSLAPENLGNMACVWKPQKEETWSLSRKEVLCCLLWGHPLSESLQCHEGMLPERRAHGPSHICQIGLDSHWGDGCCN